MKAFFIALMMVCAWVTPVHASDDRLVHDLRDFCMEVAERLAAGDADYMMDRLDQSRLLASARFAGDRPASPEEMKGMEEGLRRGLSKSAAELKSYWHVAAVKRGTPQGECTLVSSLGQGEGRGAGSLLGIRLVVGKGVDGFIIRDIIYPNGISFFEKATMILPDVFRAVAVLDAPFLHDEKRVKDATELMQLLNANKTGDKQKFVSLFKQSGGYAIGNVVLAERFIISAQQISDEEYREALRFYIENVKPEAQEPSLLIDHYTFVGKPELAVSTMERISPFYAGSYSVEYILLGLRPENGDLAEFESRMLALLEKNPNVEMAYWLLLEEYTRKHEYQRATAVLDVLRDAYGYKFGRDLQDDPVYADLGKSPEFRRWLRESS